MIVRSAHGMVASTGATGGEQPSMGPEAYPHLDAPGPGRVPLIRVGSQTSAAEEVGLDRRSVKKSLLVYPPADSPVASSPRGVEARRPTRAPRI